jgi:hypothetical protein
MNYLHFELQDLLAEALSAMEGRRYDDATAALRRALACVEADWLATPSDAGHGADGPAAADDPDDGDH